MSAYTTPIMTAVTVFPLIALLISLPFALYQYHKFGSIPWLKVVIFYTFIYYLLTVYFLIILPLPDKNDPTAFSYTGHIELVPFNNVIHYFRKNPFTFDLSYLLAFIKSAPFYEMAFNVLMVFPFGIYLRYYFKCSFPKTLLFSFLLSLFFELTQLSSLYGYYPAPYRTFDTDDLICNTLGGVLGWLMSPAFTFFLPKRKQLDLESITGSVRVSIWRRLCADIVDGILFIFVDVILAIILNFFGLTKLFGTNHQLSVFLFVQCFFAFVSHGYTPGKTICHLKVSMHEENHSLTFGILLRYFVLWCFTEGITLLENFLDGFIVTQTGMMQNVLAGLNFACYIFAFVLVIDVLLSVIRHQRMLYERISRTEIVSTMVVSTSELEQN